MTGHIPRQFIDQLLARVDLVEVIDKRLDMRKAGREYMACCPFHTEKTPSFTVSPNKQFYHCFGCGAHGNAIGFLMEYESLSFPEAVEELARSAGLEIPRSLSPEKHEDHADIVALTERAERFFREQLREHPARQRALDYLHNRGLNDEIIGAFGIGYAPPGWDRLIKSLGKEGAAAAELVSAGLIIAKEGGGHYDRFRDRIMFPIRDRRGRCIAFGARALGEEDNPKYLNSPETPVFRKGQELYGLYEARQSERNLKRVLIVEGYMDVVALAQHGIRYGVATLGTATSTAHLERLFRISKDLVFCFDGDRPGRDAAWRALENALTLLRDGRQVFFLFLPEGEDPDSLIRKEKKTAFEQRLNQAVTLSDYFFQHLSADVDLNSLDGRARFAERARPLIHKLPDGIFRDMMIQRLADTAKVVATRLSAPSQPATPKAKPGTNSNLNRLRMAIALLLNTPELATKAGDISFLKDVTAPGLPLLIELIEFLQAHPHINTAARILAQYDDTKTVNIFTQLLQSRSEIPEEQFDFESEFCQIMDKLRQDHSIEKQLLHRLALGEALDEKEKEMLLNCQKQRAKSSSA